MNRENEDVEFRYYSVDDEFPVLPLVGSRWDSKEAAVDIKNNKPHFHNLMEIGYCHHGKGKMLINNCEYEYGSGTFTIIPKFLLHDTISDIGEKNYWEYLFIDAEEFMGKCFLQNFKGENILEDVDNNYICSNKDDMPDLAGTIEAIIDEFRDREQFYKERANALIISLFLIYARRFKPQTINDDVLKNRRAIVTVLEYINNRYGDNITVASLAKRCSMSEPYFRKMFKSVVGKTPLEHINMVRIQKACNLLLSDEETIINVALRCGYSSVSTFNRNFIRYVGCTPSEYRQNHLLYKGDENFTKENYPEW